MPELPEVETVRKGLLQAILHREVKEIAVHNPHLRMRVPGEKLFQWVVGNQIVQINRRAKYLLIALANEVVLLVHLGMSGKLLVVPGGVPVERHDHVVFTLDSGEQLRFRDPRRFGLIDVTRKNTLSRHPRLVHLGIEPFSTSFTSLFCVTTVGQSRRPIKNTLMDASFVVGLGNIYTNEVLFEAGIHPQRETRSLSRQEWQRLVDAVRSVLTRALQAGGTTLQDKGFRNVLNTGGHFQVQLQVYDREGEKCPECNALIVRVRQQGRSTFFCPQCQK